MNVENKKVAVYLRVSTEGLKNGREQTTDSQRLDIENYLKSKGIEKFEVYEDIGISGTKKDRPSLNRLMKDCRQKKIGMVVIYRLDRLFRSLQNLMETMREFKELEVEFVSVKDSIDMSTAAGRLLFQVLGSFAEFEAATIKERVNSGISAARERGVKFGRPVKEGNSVVFKLRSEGRSLKEISEITKLSRQTVWRNLNEKD